MERRGFKTKMNRSPVNFSEKNAHGDEPVTAPRVKQYGGVEPRDMYSLPSVSVRSTSALMTSVDSCNRSPQCRRPSLTPRHTCNAVFAGTQAHGERKDRRLMVLAPPKESDGPRCIRLAPNGTLGSVHFESTNATGNRDTAAGEEGLDESGAYSQSSDVPPLEEQLCLEDLQRLMLVFSSTPSLPPVNDDASFERMTDFRRCGAALPSQANSSCTNTETNVKEDQSQGEQAASVEENVGKAGSLVPKRSFIVERRNKPRGALTVNSRSGLKFVFENKEELQRVLTQAWDCSQNFDRTYSRALSEDEFSQAVRRLVPAAGDDEIMDLMKRVDYEAKGTISWDDFATFLVSQGRHHSNLSQGTFGEFSNVPDPESCFPSQQHVNGTCMEADGQRNILLTGGSEGTVRAWNLNTLASCGVVFSGDCWVVGVHWANHIQGIIIVTMDRRVMILDSKTLEVRRLFRGRPVVDTFEGYMYAHDSVETVRVGASVGSKSGKLGNRNGGPPGRPSQRKKDVDGSGKPKPAPGTGNMFGGTAKGSCVQCHVEECTFAGLVDAVTCSLYHRTASNEDMLLLATAGGEVRFYSIPRTTKRVVTPHVVLLLHEKRINKMSIFYNSNALLTASDDGYVKMTSFDTGGMLRTFPTSGPSPHAAVHDFDINPNLRMLVTVGPERHGIVWDLSLDVPMATLDSHNGPCRCCAMQLDQRQIVTVGADGVIFIFEAQGFRLIQIIGVDRLHPQRVVSDPLRKRIICLAAFPYSHGRNRNMALAYSSKYKGHMAPMVGVMYSAIHDLIITVDSEGLVMTWKRATGGSSFTFQIKEFSDSAVMNAARLTCFALDKLERRLLTGFNNGAAAVWNLMNGQTTNVITAAAEGTQPSTVAPGVTALGTLMREGLTFFIFAAGGCLYSTRESSTFTIASASKWEVPAHFGEVLHIMAVSPHCIVCGTSYGALFFYRVLAERQEGSVLWVMETVDMLARSTCNVSEARRGEQPSTATTSRIVKIFPLRTVGEHILMSVHADGTVALWHTLRRTMMGVVSLRSAFPVKGLEVGLTHAAADTGGQYFVFSDEQGNIHVCSILLRETRDDASMFETCVTLVHDDDKKPTVSWPGSPFCTDGVPPVFGPMDDVTCGGDDAANSSGEVKQQTGSLRPRSLDTEKTLYTFSRFRREYVFHCGFNAVTGLALVDDPKEITVRTCGQEPEEAAGQDVGEEDCSDIGGLHLGASTSSLCDVDSTQNLLLPSVDLSSTMMITVSSGVDNLTRVFMLDGLIVGECGMNTWVAGKESTYQFLSVKPSRRLPPHSCSADPINFLAEALSSDKAGASKQMRSNWNSRGGVPRSDCQTGQDNAASVICEAGLPTFQNIGVALVDSAGGERTPMVQLSSDPVEREPSVKPQQQSCQIQGEEPGSDKVQGAASPRALSTFMRPQRSREAMLKGLVKPKFINALRGIPVEEGGEELASFIISPVSRSGGKKQHRADQASEHSHTLYSRNGSAINQTPASVRHATELSVSEVQQSGAQDGRPVPSQPALAAGLPTPHQASRQLRTHSWAVQGRRCPTTSHDVDTTPALTKTHAGPHQSSGGGVNNVSLEGDTSPRGALHEHIDSRRRHLLSLGCKDPVVLAVPCTTNTNTKGESTAVSGSDRKRNTASGSTALLRRIQGNSILEARSRVAQITSRLLMAPVEEIVPPKGTRVKEQTTAWKNVVKNATSASQQ